MSDELHRADFEGQMARAVEVAYQKGQEKGRAGLENENQRLRALYENAVNIKAKGWTIDHLMECEEALRTVEERAQRLEEGLEKLADIHHRTLKGSRLHDPENIQDWRACPCLTCMAAKAAMQP